MRHIIYLVLSLVLLDLSAQDIPLVTNKVLIKDVMITTQPSASPFLGDILISDGLIERVQSDITPPYDAKVLEGDSMYVYAGFIAPASHIGLKTPEGPKDTNVARRGYPPNDIAGITPEKSIAEYYSTKESSIKDFREQGFSIAHILPDGMMLPGQGAIISLGGDPLNKSIIIDNSSMFAKWETADVFPSTLIGIMSKWRELYRNAELTQKHAQGYKSNPLNRKRPAQDEATEALWPVVSRQLPVYFKAEKLRDITRTLQLQKDLGFDLVITEARDVDRILDMVKGTGAHILLSLDLPDKMEEKKSDQDSTQVAATDEEKKKEALRLRKSSAIDRYTSQAKLLTEQGTPFSFSYLETKGKDVHPHIKRMVEGGLDKGTALEALTTGPASLLGISDIAGTIEGGKLGNLVMMTGPIWEEDTKIKTVFVDGTSYELEVKKKKKKEASEGDADLDLAGTWNYSIEIPGMTPKGTLIFTKSGDGYDITVTSNQNPGEDVEGEEIEIDGSNVTFTFSMEAGPGMSISVENSLDFDGDSFEGTVSVSDFGSFDITGTKASPEN